MLLLAEQERALWDKTMIARGLLHLDRLAAGKEISESHLKAEITCYHCTAPNYHATNWQRMLSLYDLLIEINNSPVIALNRAVAIMGGVGPEARPEPASSRE